MRRIFLTAVLALGAILVANQEEQSTKIETSVVIDFFESGAKNENPLLCGLIPPVCRPIPIPPTTKSCMEETVMA